MRKPLYDMAMFKERRQELSQKAAGSAIIIPSHPELIRNNDVHYPHRQDSNFFYLTGFEEPDSILVVRPGQNPETVIFVRPKDAERETWDGFRYGPEGTEQNFKIDKAYLISDFDKVIIDLLKPVERLYYRWNLDSEMDEKILGLLKSVRLGHGRSGRGYLPIFDSWELLGEMRIRKSPFEMTQMRKAAEISANAHMDAMRFTRPGVNERQVQAILLDSMLSEGASREGYNSIVASGAAATTLHYIFNDQPCRDGDLLLIDAGAEYGYYTGDITRTFPVSGKFTAPQRLVYEKVLAVQKYLIEIIKPGLAFKTLQDTAVDKLTDCMLELGLLKGNKQQLIEKLEYKKYYPHGVSHWLGMDVHDVGLYLVKGESRPLEVGMCLTIEPGLYIPIDDMTAPPELRGIGIRIEDDILVTPTGAENMTSAVPKEINEIEALIGANYRT